AETLTWLQVAPPSVLRNRPTSVAASTTRLLWGSTLMSVTLPAVSATVERPELYVAWSWTGADQVPPPSPLRTRPGCWTSKGSPNPRKRISGLDGSIARVPTDVVPRASVSGSQWTVEARASYVFQTPPPAVARYSTSGSIGCARI